MPTVKPIISGELFGRWAVLEKTKILSRTAYHECRCDCGNIKFVSVYKLRSSQSKSCGCLQAEITSKRSLAHGFSRTRTRVYRIWCCMITRCINPNASNYGRYGGRGIKVSEQWRKFENFLRDMGEPPEGFSIDRLNNNGNYCRENCAWRSPLDQAKNRRKRTRGKTDVDKSYIRVG
jgi:hypothetical protein